MDTRERTLAAAQRALAREELDADLSGSAMRQYRRTRAQAVLATVEWVEGVQAFAPASGVFEDGTLRSAMDRERVRAHDLEAAARGNASGWFPGVVEQLLAYLLGREGAQPPFVG